MKRRFNRRAIFRLLLLVAILLVGFLTLTQNPPTTPKIENIDKIAHMVFFFVLAFFADRAFPARFNTTLLPFLFAYGGVIELLQGQLPYRSASLADFIADLCGIALYLLSRTGYRWFNRRASH